VLACIIPPERHPQKEAFTMTRGKRILGRSLMSLAALAVCAALAGSAAAQLELGGRATPQVATPPFPGSSSMVVTSPTLQADG